MSMQGQGQGHDGREACFEDGKDVAVHVAIQQQPCGR